MKTRRPWSMRWHQFVNQHLTTSARLISRPDGSRMVLVCECKQFWEVDS